MVMVFVIFGLVVGGLIGGFVVCCLVNGLRCDKKVLFKCVEIIDD